MALVTAAHENSAVQGALLYNAVGLEPFMDVIWTTADQPGNIANQGKLARRTNVELQAIVAALASGPVGIGDGPVSTSRHSTVRQTASRLARLALEALGCSGSSVPRVLYVPDLRVDVDCEDQGLDLTEHGERGYDLS